MASEVASIKENSQELQKLKRQGVLTINSNYLRFEENASVKKLHSASFAGVVAP